MSEGDFSLFDLFREEVRAHTATLNEGLLELENDSANPQRIEPLMRAAHSIKGASRIVNVERAVQLAHVMEDALVAAQSGRIRIAPADIDLLLKGTDILAGLADIRESTVADWNEQHAVVIGELAQAFERLAQGQPTPVPSVKAPVVSTTAKARPAAMPPLPPRAIIAIPAEPIVPGEDEPILDLFREEVRIHCEALYEGLPNLLDAGRAPESFAALIQAVHVIQGAARIVNIEPAVHSAQRLEQLLVEARDGSMPAGAELVEFALRLTDLLAVYVDAASAEAVVELAVRNAAHSRRLCEILDGKRAKRAEPMIPAEPTSTAIAQAPQQVPVPAVPVHDKPVPAETSAATATVPAEAEEAVVRVTAKSLNRLMNLAGESLVQARWLQPFSSALLKFKKQQDHLAGLLDNLAQSLASTRHSDSADALIAEARRQAAQCRQVLMERMGEFEDHAARAEDLNSRLYREVIVSRMRPFADGAHGLPRLVRDMARRLNKQVRLDIVGAATEVDRDILEKLEAPLTHLVRNAVDHGIEMPEDRQAKGKPETGVIRVEVRHRAGMLAITISDDGGGIDLVRLRRKVVERGLTTSDLAQSMQEVELLEFLFLPGFSTAAAVTEFSGRGVGLDVVQDTVRKVGGSVHITSRFGEGTRFHLLLPITLSVLRAVLVNIAGEPYAFPHNRIDRLLPIPQSAIRSLENRQYVTIDGQSVGLVLAAQILDLPAQPPNTDELPVLLMSDATGTYGLIVQAFRGEQDLVVRPLDARLGKVPNISAAAILDDGMPVLIADVDDLTRTMDQYIQTGSLLRCEREQTVTKTRKRVLVVDDSITVREVERQILRNQGFDVSVAVDGKEGWNMVRNAAYDLVITDVDMPRMNGLELVQAIRGEPELKTLPVIIISYKEREEDRLRGLQVGANYYLTKSSFHDNTFLQAVTDLVGES